MKSTHKQLRSLAFSIVETDIVNTKDILGLLENLSVKEARFFLGQLKQALARKTVVISTAEKLNDEVKEYFENNFKNNTIRYTEDKTIGGGVIVKISDDVYDYSVQNYINSTITKLEEEL